MAQTRAYTSSQALRPVIAKTCRSKLVLLGLVKLGLAFWFIIRLALGITTGFGWIIEPLFALVMGGLAIYLFALAIFRPVALRMDIDGISGYYAPPLTWEDISEFDTFKQYVEDGPFFTTYVGIKIARKTSLFSGMTPRRYERAMRSANRTGFHILIPQMILKDRNAANIVFEARRFQNAAKSTAETAQFR